MNRQPPPPQQQQQKATRPASAPTSARTSVTPTPSVQPAGRPSSVDHQNMWIEPGLTQDSDASLGFEWQLRKLGSNQTWGCKVSAPDGHTVTLQLSQPPYERSLRGEGIVDLVAIPVAGQGISGTLTARDEVTGATARFTWTWKQSRGGPVAKPKAPAARASATASAKKSQTQTASTKGSEQTQAVHDAKVVNAQSFFGLAVSGNRVAFILDKSGSMSGGRWAACTRQLEAALTGLAEGTEFFVVLYAESLLEPPGQRGWSAATPARVAGVIEWLRHIRPDGGTDPRPAFERVFRLPGRPESVYFLTDGEFDGFSIEECERLQRHGSTSKLGAAIGTLGRWFSPSGNRNDATVPINAVTLDDGSSAELLEGIAQSSGGRYIHSISV
ncbi:MAG: hypothetical protein ABW110_08925 [Steroidobacteraceae bacterium]